MSICLLLSRPSQIDWLFILWTRSWRYGTLRGYNIEKRGRKQAASEHAGTWKRSRQTLETRQANKQQATGYSSHHMFFSLFSFHLLFVFIFIFASSSSSSSSPFADHDQLTTTIRQTSKPKLQLKEWDKQKKENKQTIKLKKSGKVLRWNHYWFSVFKKYVFFIQFSLKDGTKKV